MKKAVAVLLIILTTFALFGCSGFVGAELDAYCNSEELNVTQIIVRLHNKDDVCCINDIHYELEYFDGNEIDVYIPQEVILAETDKAYTVSSLGGQGIGDNISIFISIKNREFTDEELLALKVNIHLGNVALDEIHNPQVVINDSFHRNYDNYHFVE